MVGVSGCLMLGGVNWDGRKWRCFSRISCSITGSGSSVGSWRHIRVMFVVVAVVLNSAVWIT